LKVIAVHSFKGGTGKSLIATNLAAYYALKGHDTCLIDLDFRAPTLHVVFKPQGLKYWLNDYLDAKCSVEEAIFEAGPKLKLSSKLSVAFANPSPEAIREMMAKGLAWERQALRRLLDLTKRVGQLGYKYCILDTSPGYLYSAINALVAADASIIVLTMDESDRRGVKEMLNDLYRLLERKPLIVLNKVVGSAEEAVDLVRKELGGGEVEAVACSCDVAMKPREDIHVVEEPNHPFARSIERIALKVA
jgi:MinD-like ATPase involved in chromosome partitioning or flagellar assembly